MEFWPENDPPTISNRYLVSVGGEVHIADYCEKKKYFTIGKGMDCEKIRIDGWAYIPVPFIYMAREIGEGEFIPCSRDWFIKCQTDPLMDTKKVRI